MKNKTFCGDTITITAPVGGTTSGSPVLVGTVLGIAVSSVAAGSPAAVQLEGVFTVTKLTADDVAVGDKLYWDAGNSRLTKTSSGNTEAGIAFAAAGTSATTVSIKLKGR